MDCPELRFELREEIQMLNEEQMKALADYYGAPAK